MSRNPKSGWLGASGQGWNYGVQGLRDRKFHNPPQTLVAQLLLLSPREVYPTVDDEIQHYLRTLKYGNYGIFLTMGNAGSVSSTVGIMLSQKNVKSTHPATTKLIVAPALTAAYSKLLPLNPNMPVRFPKP